MNTTDLKQKLAATADKAKETATAAYDTATEAGRTVTSEVKAQAADAFETARGAAAEHADAARDSLVNAGDRLAATLQTEAQSVDGVPSRLLNGLAGGVATVTDGLRDRSLSDLFAEAKGYAQRNPGTFAVGAAVAGFALARFLGSSSNRMTAEARAAEATDRIYREAARRSIDTLGQDSEGSRR